MNQLHLDDLRGVVGFLPEDIITILKTTNTVVAGGFIRARVAHEDAADIDLFTATADAGGLLAQALADRRQVKLFRTRNAFTILSPPRAPVQFIHRWSYADPLDLVASFDFTIAQAAVWWAPTERLWMSAVSPMFYRDLAARRLRYTFPARHEDVGGSLLRVQKFIRKGYDISPEQLASVISRLLSGVRQFRDDEPEMNGLWGKGEVGRAAVLAGLLRLVDPMMVIDGITPHPDMLAGPDDDNPDVQARQRLEAVQRAYSELARPPEPGDGNLSS
jgi:hypothetical protein